MDAPDESGPYDDELSAADASRARWVAAAVVVVLLVGGIAIARAGHRSSAPHPVAVPTASSEPGPVTVTPRQHLGSVFLEHLPDCTLTDHRHHLVVSLAVTNLGDRALRLVSATGLTSNPFVVRPTTLTLGPPPCGSGRSEQAERLAPGGVAIVRLQFYVADKCPGTALVSARLAFDGGNAGLIHADSSELANLSQLDFAQCV